MLLSIADAPPVLSMDMVDLWIESENDDVNARAPTEDVSAADRDDIDALAGPE